MNLHIAPLSLCLLLVALPAAVMAKTMNERPEVRQFMAMMVDRHDFDLAELDRIFSQVESRTKIIAAMKRPAESKPWYAYRPIFITDKRIDGGVAYWQRHAADFERAQARYGVPPEIVAAIIGIESYYGRHKGRDRVIDALSTLGFDYPARGRFFRGELEQFLLLAREEGRDPLSFMGSYAGAMGKAQFIPSSYRHYAIDFDGDHRRDLIDSDSDAIGSVAHYLANHGWLEGGAIASRARIDGKGFEPILSRGLKPSTTIGEMQQHGIEIDTTLPRSTLAALIALEQRNGTDYWVVLQNFYVITRYNHSPLYAMAVHQLARQIRERHDLVAARRP